jgi:hypothetical protein
MNVRGRKAKAKELYFTADTRRQPQTFYNAGLNRIERSPLTESQRPEKISESENVRRYECQREEA